MAADKSSIEEVASGKGADTLTMSDVLEGVPADGSSLNHYLNFEYDPATHGTKITIDSTDNGATTSQVIVLDSVDLTAGGSLTTAAILEGLLSSDSLNSGT